MVNICDAIMGSGKTESVITYINEHPDDKYIYAAPYLDESSRIREGCRDMHFVEPEKKYETDFSKVVHNRQLIEAGSNIATTHQCLKSFTDDMMQSIQDQGYILFLDECMDFMDECDISDNDIEMLITNDYFTMDNGSYSWTGREYEGGKFDNTFWAMGSRSIVERSESVSVDPDDVDRCNYRYWMLSPDVFRAFKDVYILTYMFDGQNLKYFLDMNDIPYRYIGITRTQSLYMTDVYRYEFCDHVDYIPEYVCDIRSMIDILEDNKLNAEGDNYYALSKSWFSLDSQRNRARRIDRANDISHLKKHLSNYFTNIHRDISGSNRMWSTFKSARDLLKGDGYARGYTSLNLKATNQYMDRTCLAYACNLFMPVPHKIYYQSHGLDVNEDAYALSMMVQWIWRSAIRDGQKIHLYLPSSRMRRILYDWMDSLERGGVTH